MLLLLLLLLLLVVVVVVAEDEEQEEKVAVEGRVEGRRCSATDDSLTCHAYANVPRTLARFPTATHC